LLEFQTVKALEEKLKKANIPSEVYIYPKVGHGFMNSSPEGIERNKALGFGEHHQEAVNLAWSRFESWFAKYLQ
jgi:carboxymethylenebutenolidase